MGIEECRNAAQRNGATDVYPRNQDEDDRGITLREHYAGLALQGLLSSRVYTHASHAEAVGQAVQLADALLLALETSREEVAL